MESLGYGLTMNVSIVGRMLRLIFIISLIMLFFTTWIWQTINNKHATGDLHRQKVIHRTRSRSLVEKDLKSVSRLLTRMKEDSFLHLIIQFPLISNGSDSLHPRQMEFVQTLQRNLDHPMVRQVHVLCESDHVIKFIKNIFISNKLVLRNIGRRMRYSDAFAYVSDTLLFDTCAIMNADCYIGNGFEYLDTKILRQGTIYALTRHEDSKHITDCGVQDFCGGKSKYIGSHDAFVVNLVHPLSSEVLRRLDYMPNIVGVENVVIFVLKKYGHFRVKNPCRILHIIHNHCSRKRKDRRTYGQRLEKYLKVPKGVAAFSGL